MIPARTTPMIASTTSSSGSVKPSCAAATRRTWSRARIRRCGGRCPGAARAPRERPAPRARRPSPVPRSWTACSLSARSRAIMKSCRLGAAAAAVSWSTSPLTTRSINAFVSVCIWKNAPSAIASGTSSGLFSRINSWMRAFATITSTAAMRPPSVRGSSRCEMTPLSTPARIERTCGCFAAGKNSTSRPSVSAASTVCIVESTRWPDSAAWSAVSADSRSRSSPIRITSGSWRSTRLRASSNDSVSIPTSRWLTMLCSSSWRNSIGSSIVTTCCRRVRLMWPTIAASVVVLPTPVAPVTRISPRCSSDSVSTPGGRRRLLKPGTVCGMTRKASEISPRWRNALTRKRGRPCGW